ncbi:hypothetical protein ACFL2Q_14340 [Thermodesulfobacteriota bacterium]
MAGSSKPRKLFLVAGLVLLSVGCFSPPNAFGGKWNDLVKGPYRIHYQPRLKWMAKNLPTGVAFRTLTSSYGNWGTSFQDEDRLISAARRNKITVYLQQDRSLKGQQTTGEYRIRSGNIIVNVSGAFNKYARIEAGGTLVHETAHYFLTHTIGPGRPRNHQILYNALRPYEKTSLLAIQEGLAFYYEDLEYKKMTGEEARRKIRDELAGAKPMSWTEAAEQYDDDSVDFTSLLEWRLASIGWYLRWGFYSQPHELWRYMKYAFTHRPAAKMYHPVCYNYYAGTSWNYWTWDYHGSYGLDASRTYHIGPGDRVVDWAITTSNRVYGGITSSPPPDLKGEMPSRIDGTVIEGNANASVYMNYCYQVYEDPW